MAILSTELRRTRATATEKIDLSQASKQGAPPLYFTPSPPLPPLLSVLLPKIRYFLLTSSSPNHPLLLLSPSVTHLLLILDILPLYFYKQSTLSFFFLRQLSQVQQLAKFLST